MARGVFDGIRVLDLTQIIAGPFGCMMQDSRIRLIGPQLSSRNPEFKELREI